MEGGGAWEKVGVEGLGKEGGGGLCAGSVWVRFGSVGRDLRDRL